MRVGGTSRLGGEGIRTPLMPVRGDEPYWALYPAFGAITLKTKIPPLQTLVSALEPGKYSQKEETGIVQTSGLL